MPGLGHWGSAEAADQGPRISGAYPLGVSQTLYPGDPVVLSTLAALGGPTPTLRRLVLADQTALYATGAGDICGILGLAREGIVTDAAGLITGKPAPVVLAAGVAPRYALPTVASTIPMDVSATHQRAQVLLATDDTIFSGTLWENTTVTGALLGVAVGLFISTIAGVPSYFWSTAAAVPIGRIVRLAEIDPLYNTAVTANVANTTHNIRAVIGVKLLQAYQQINSRFQYAT